MLRSLMLIWCSVFPSLPARRTANYESYEVFEVLSFMYDSERLDLLERVGQRG